jgi:pimeloyl-ACP methyl ester carboxylesterase
MTSTPIVLVHGGFHGAWCWERLVPHLAEREVHRIELQSSGPNVAELTDIHKDAGALRELLDGLDTSCVLVGHSYGGAVITQASAGHERVAHLVYLSAFMPAAGQSALDTFQPAPTWVKPTADGRALELAAPASAADVFYNTCDAATAQWACERIHPFISLAAGVAPLTAAGWESITSTYVISTRDHALDPVTQRRMAQQATSVIEVATDHSSFMCQPDLIASILLDAADGIGR